MCNQSVGLIAGIIEKAGIATVGLSLLLAWPLLTQDVFYQRIGALVMLAAISASPPSSSAPSSAATTRGARRATRRSATPRRSSG